MSDDPVRLQNAQRDIRDAYFAHDSGLFTLNCVPGAGKSEVTNHIAAEDILRRHVDGCATPEQRVGVISFNKKEAETIVPEICDRLKEIVEHDLVPFADSVTSKEVEYLIQRIRRSTFIGTIDSILRDVLSEIATAVGFEEMPVVGNAARLKQLHSVCYLDVQADQELQQRIDRLEDSYPDEEYDDSVSDMLEAAVKHCRNQCISTDEFRTELERTFDDVYAEGRPDSFDDVIEAVARCVGSNHQVSAYTEITEKERNRICEADSKLYDDWEARIDDFCVVFETYRRRYRQHIRDLGVVSHTDVAYIVDAYFDDRLNDVDTEPRIRIEQRYQTRLQSLIIDEAQDVSLIQHAALSHLVTSDAQVCAAGDLLQSIYLWRHAEPTLFETAIVEGEYLGNDWDTHEHRTAKTTYRCVPDVAAAINQISEAALTDPARGNIGELDVCYPGLKADRDPVDQTSVHIAGFDPIASDPDSYSWVDPGNGRGEAPKLATLLAKGLADGTFTDANDDPLGITVLFRWSSKMDAYESAFEEQGLSVRNTSEYLFDCDVVTTVVDVCEWLIAPTNLNRTRDLVTGSNLGLKSLRGTLEKHNCDIEAVSNDDDLTDSEQSVVDSLIELRDRRDSFLSRPAATYIEDIIQILGLRADPDDLFNIEPAQRVANLDALIKTINGWEADGDLPLAELIELTEPFCENPYKGPNQPSTGDTSHDVEFRTVHDSKGDQDDVIVIANPGFDLWKQGPQSSRFLTQGDIVGLAPPPSTEVPSEVSLSPFVNGLYDPEDTRYRDVGLRWATGHWRDSVDESANTTSLVGPRRLTQVAANERAEGWRLLYVALTRARDHLVLPLPRSNNHDPSPRDRWLDTIKDGLQFDGDQTGTYSVGTGSQSFDVGINDADFWATWSSRTGSHRDDVAINSPRYSELESWVPRFVNPSTIYPLTQDPDGQVLNHLLGNALHTETNDVPDDVPMEFKRLGPDDVGNCLHAVLTSLIEREVSEHTLQSVGSEVREVFNDVVDDIAPRLSDAEHEELFTFFKTAVLSDFVDSELWTQIQRADLVFVERFVDGLVTIDDVETEIHGTADIVIKFPSGDTQVTDIKIALTNQIDETHQRYKLQATTYAYLLENQSASMGSVRPTIEIFGVERDTFEPEWSSQIVEKRLADIVSK